MKSVMTLGAAVAALAVLAAGSASLVAAEHEHGGHFARCAKVCDDCQRECDSCFRHCAGLVAEGKKEHARCMRLCVDCGELCSAAAKPSARQSELAVPACEACA